MDKREELRQSLRRQMLRISGGKLPTSPPNPADEPYKRFREAMSELINDALDPRLSDKRYREVTMEMINAWQEVEMERILNGNTPTGW